MSNDTANRILWLVLVPTAFAVLTWVLLFVVGEWTADRLNLAALVPLACLAPAPAYRWLSKDPIPLWPFLVLALAIGGYTAATLDLAAAVAVEPDGNFIPVVTVVGGFFLPAITAACGMLSTALAGRHVARYP
ncbi:hypothetical protein [Marmoricola sp. RAF53]|uniref:hypothetical protein n=1 Tax=Marmoricola sp. RAF53 TaxID=3233059 RepID=UPI003F97D5D7